MPRKKKQRYGDYCEVLDGHLYAAVSIPLGNGKYKRKRKKVDSKTDARNWALAELEKAKHGSITGTFETLRDLAEWYKTHFVIAPVIEKGKQIEGSKDWQKNRAKLDRLIERFGYRRLQTFTERDLNNYSRERRQAVTQATINRDLALIRAMFRKGKDADRSLTIPRIPIIASAETERDRVMSADEERAILAACAAVEEREFTRKDTGTVVKTSKHRTNREHLRPLVILAVDTAMRMGEILQLEWSDIDLDSGVITVRSETTKTKRSRKVPITTRARLELAALPPDRPFHLNSCYKAFKTACERAAINDLNFHDLRHTATTRMIRAGIPYMEVMKITGHRQMKTFLRYLNPEDLAVQSAASRLDDLIRTNETS